MYTIWRTDHEINSKITDSFRKGSLRLSKYNENMSVRDTSLYDGVPTHSVAYGILRGTGDIFRDCLANNKEFWEIDRGYFRAKHFSGYYRISLNDMRASYSKLNLPIDRWDKLELNISPWREYGFMILVCPPSKHVCEFYGVKLDDWIKDTVERIEAVTDKPIKIRKKSDTRPLIEDLSTAHCVVTFNSNVSVEALMHGVPVIATNSRDIISWNGLQICDIEGDKLRDFDRMKLFNYLSYCQFTLEEFESGEAWRLANEVQK